MLPENIILVCLGHNINILLHSIQRELQLLQQGLGFLWGPVAAACSCSSGGAAAAASIAAASAGTTSSFLPQLLPACVHKYSTVQDGSALQYV
jgi:hypothetical protein